MNSRLADWRLSLRIARREALRAKGRSILVLVMIALPVLAVTAADVLVATTQVDSVEGLDRRLGTAAALVEVQQGAGRVQQEPDPLQGSSSQGSSSDSPAKPGITADEIARLLGGARLLPLRQGESDVRTRKGVGYVETLEVDLADPLTHGLVELESGRLPRSPDEVVINEALAAKGYSVGDELDLQAGDGATAPSPTIVGLAESTTTRTTPYAVGPLGSLGLERDDVGRFGVGQSYLVDGGPVSWAQVKRLNRSGATVLSRAVIEDPPSAADRYPDLSSSSGLDAVTVTVLVLVVVMALIEVVLLAGPAFAVGARRQQRSLALMAAAGGTPTQARRVILASAVVLGGAAAVVGVVVGILLGVAGVPVVQRYSGEYLGPLDLRWLHLAGVAAFGLLAAFLAALVPARIASRQDVVAVLAGRRGDRSTPVGTPVAGLVLLGVGVLAAVYGSGQVGSSGGVLIAVSAILCVLAMILLVPLVLALVARGARRLPLVVRYAARDASRHRTRTVPAVAAVAATVAGVVALGIATSSDEAQNRETYVPSVADGVGTVTGSVDDWPAVEAAVRREAPDATVSVTRGLVEDAGDDGYTYVSVQAPGVQVAGGSTFGASVLVVDGDLPPGLLGLTDRTRATAEAALAAGKVVAFSDTPSSATRARVSWESNDPSTGQVTRSGARTLPAVVVRLTTSYAGPTAVVPTRLAAGLRTPSGIVGLTLSGTTLSTDEETDVREAVAAISENTGVNVERGYQADDSAVIVQLVLAALGAVLMLGGTLTATFLALSDARPDLATLAAVGASPGNRRGVAAAYALVVGVVGAALGAVVGFVPGWAISVTLTSTQSYTSSTDLGDVASGTVGPFFDVPWLLVLGLVVVLPLLVSALVAATSRSRLPLAARLD